MQLFLADDYPWNTVYTDEAGAPQYKTHTPIKLHDRTTAISRVVEADIPRRADEPEDSPRFASLAQIDWRVVESTVIHFRGRELATQEFFHKEELGWVGRCAFICSCGFHLKE